jgi:hypothetical protein
MENAQPFEVVGAALTVYFAPVGTAKPTVDVDPPLAPWTKVGKSGPLNYDDDGLVIDHQQSFNPWRALGHAGIRKMFRTEEGMMYRLTLVDLTLESYSLALNSNAVTVTPAGVGTAGVRKLGLSRGLSVATVALLVRGPSPYMANGIMQWFSPITSQTGSPAPVFQRSDPAGLDLEWTVLVDGGAANDQEYFGVAEAQDAEALS